MHAPIVTTPLSRSVVSFFHDGMFYARSSIIYKPNHPFLDPVTDTLYDTLVWFLSCSSYFWRIGNTEQIVSQLWIHHQGQHGEFEQICTFFALVEFHLGVFVLLKSHNSLVTPFHRDLHTGNLRDDSFILSRLVHFHLDHHYNHLHEYAYFCWKYLPLILI